MDLIVFFVFIFDSIGGKDDSDEGNGDEEQTGGVAAAAAGLVLGSSRIVAGIVIGSALFWHFLLFLSEWSLAGKKGNAKKRWDLKEKAKKAWYNAIANLRVETSSISKWKKWSIWSVEVLSYATAVNLNATQ